MEVLMSIIYQSMEQFRNLFKVFEKIFIHPTTFECFLLYAKYMDMVVVADISDFPSQ